MGELGIELVGAQPSRFSDATMEAATGLVCESAEVLEAISKSHRSWKPDPDFEAKREHALEEAVDVFFYLLEIFISLGVTDGKELMRLFLKKREIVLKRIQDAKEKKAK